jgi:signal transduction histidine kinase
MPTRGRALPIAFILGLLVVGGAVGLRVLDVTAGRFPLGTAWFPGLLASGGLIAAILLVRRAPAIAWFATVAAAAIAAIEIVGVVRSRPAGTTFADWPIAIAVAASALVVAAGIAAAYAFRRPTSGATTWISVWRALVLAGLAAVAVGAVLAIIDAAATTDTGIDPDPAVAIGPLRTSGRIAAAFIAIATLGGLWLDLSGPFARARARGGGLPAFPRALADELLPTSAAMRRRGVEDERARLAAELHARVLPDLRRAAEAAAHAAKATGTPSDPLAVGLRHAVEDVEELMHGRQSVVLEEYGLVAALEWLAERTQQRRALEVDLELGGSEVDSPTTIPKPVARAAFRVAQLAVDNVVRHAHARRVVLRLTIDAARLQLAIEDDGTGFEPGRRPQPGRGLADMRAAAAEVGATIRVHPQPRGTLVDLVLERRPAAAEPGVSPEAAAGR